VAEDRLSDSVVLKALGHPVRREVLAALDEGIASPKELAARLGLSIPNVSYHVGVLRELGLIRVVRETPRRGAIERHYRATARGVGVRQVLGWVLASDRTRPRGWKAKVLALDGPGRDAVGVAVERFWRDVERAEAQAARRLARSGEAADRLAAGTWTAPAGQS
jgi:DNA-binding transcriptional ArsR family regulator